MSIKRRALRSALKTAHREEVRAAAHFGSIANSVRDAQLHGTFLQFSAQAQGAIAMVEGLLDARGVGKPALLSVTRLRAGFLGSAARLRGWRGVVEDALDRTERRGRRMAEAASNARLAGDFDAARRLDGLRDGASVQAGWFRDFLK